MPFPGYPLAGGKTNATLQSNDHPNHHNALAAAVNDLQAQTTTVNDAYISKLLFDAKGDILVATAADTVARQAIGANNLVLVADSGQTNGLKWAAVMSESTVATDPGGNAGSVSITITRTPLASGGTYIVQLSGTMQNTKGSNWSPADILANVPAGYRPGGAIQNRFMANITAGGVAFASIGTNGDITFASGTVANNAFVTLEISYVI